MALRKLLDDNEKDMDFCIKPKHFDTVVMAALTCANAKDALKLGFDLKRLASIKLGRAIMKEDEKKRKEAEDFLTLMTMQWSMRVSKLARTKLNERSFNRRRPLPLPSDFKKLSAFMVREVQAIKYVG